jgi:predicted RNase H-like HicB family nuclease
MRSRFTLEFWRDGDWSVGRLLEVPGVFSQGETLEELRENIQDAYDLMVTQDRPPASPAAQRQPLEPEPSASASLIRDDVEEGIFRRKSTEILGLTSTVSVVRITSGDHTLSFRNREGLPNVLGVANHLLRTRSGR